MVCEKTKTWCTPRSGVRYSTVTGERMTRNIFVWFCRVRQTQAFCCKRVFPGTSIGQYRFERIFAVYNQVLTVAACVNARAKPVRYQ